MQTPATLIWCARAQFYVRETPEEIFRLVSAGPVFLSLTAHKSGQPMHIAVAHISSLYTVEES